MIILRWVCVAGMVALLGACATKGPVSPPAEISKWPSAMAAKRAAKLIPIRSWSLKGRLGIQLPSEGLSAGIEWLQNKKEYQIKLFDQLGRQVALLTGGPGRVALKTSKGDSFHGRNAEKLLQKHLGWTIPVESLFYWVRGLPDPNTVAWREDYDDAGHLVALSQGGWRVRLSRYDGEGITALPQLVRIEREDIKLKLLIKEWQ